jgi:hypothetical protein
MKLSLVKKKKKKKLKLIEKPKIERRKNHYQCPPNDENTLSKKKKD